jgi:hypothetical protein
VLLLAGEYDAGLRPRNAGEYAGLFGTCRVGGAAQRRALSPARRSRVVHADAGGLSRLTASTSSVAATVALVGVGPSCAAPMPRSATSAAQ